MSGRYRPFWELTRAGLRFAALRLGLVLDAGAEDRLMNQYRHLSSFPENRDVLAELKALGIPAAILSNGDPEMLAVAVKSAGLEPFLAQVLSVDAVRRYKTDPATYALGTQAFDLPARQILFVSSNCWDAIGATWFGYTTLWVNRAGLPVEQLDTSPTRIGASLRDVLDFFSSEPPPTQ
jgi:2-haloacid dehalogenase